MTDNYRLPPSSIESEQSVLGSILLDAQSDRVQRVFSFLSADMFYTRQHAVIYRVVREMNSKSQTIDLLTVADRMESTGDLESVGGFAYLAEVQKNTPSSANVLAYANRVKDCAIERFAIEQANQMLEVFYTPSALSTDEKLEHMQSLAMRIDDKTRSGSSRGLVPFSEVFQEWMTVVDGRLSKDPAAIGLTSGIKALDDVLEPKRMVKGSLFVVGARPKMGKTTLYTTMAINCALNEGLPALAFSLEMPRVQLAENMISQNSRVNSKVFYLSYCQIWCMKPSGNAPI